MLDIFLVEMTGDLIVLNSDMTLGRSRESLRKTVGIQR